MSLRKSTRPRFRIAELLPAWDCYAHASTAGFRIKEIAQRLGYSPDPMLSGLAVYRMSQRPSAYHSNIAWIDSWPERETSGDFWEYHVGALARAKELGYNLEDIRMVEIEYNSKRLEQILDAKGITGLLLAPCFHAGAELNLDYSRFSAVRLGYSYRSPLLHTVVNAQFHTVYSAFRKVVEAGYRRIGIILTEDLDERTGWNCLGGFTAGQKLLAKMNRIEPFYLNSHESSDIGSWISQSKVDALLGFGHWPAIHATGLEVGYADLSLPSDEKHISGMHQNCQRIGISAVEFLTSMMHRGETGIPVEPTSLCVQSRWLDRNTLCPGLGR